MSKEAAFYYAFEFIAAKRGRSMVKSTLAKLRRSWHDKYEEYYELGDTETRSWWGEEEYALSAKIEAALRYRAAANANYRKVLSKLDKQFGKGLVWQPDTGIVDLEYLKRQRNKAQQEQQT